MTNSGRAEDPRWTGTAWIAVRYRDLATPITGMPNSARACAPRPGRPSGSRSAWPSTTSRRSPLRSARTAQRRELAQVELARPVAEYLGQDRGALSQHVCEGGQHGCGPGAAGARGSARPRRRTRRTPGVRRFPCLEDARTYARHQDRILAAACTSPRQAAQQVTKRNWPASSARTCNRLMHGQRDRRVDQPTTHIGSICVGGGWAAVGLPAHSYRLTDDGAVLAAASSGGLGSLASVMLLAGDTWDLLSCLGRVPLASWDCDQPQGEPGAGGPGDRA